MRKIRNNKGFTLVEMMIVLLIISILILVTIPNVTKQSASIDSKGCEALVKMVEGQVGSYKLDHNGVPTMDQLISEKYLTESNKTCSNGSEIIITNGVVSVVGKNNEQ